ncbi:SGNH/GDSL hydrolase family protein [Thalassotalea euphylliae]|uniref:SGNH/GDSL hydrolase family protein n=1 Tax=Thalassotalea euphylliae TaxID=1655234 RepID=A0A3E0TYD9_9GAMM|nr:SGNH/GDSL hydrolase family protein [Thalassotalea euphylliae]REL29470.1 SGNH/GDSL hydrolase family protein [Thalassotalea euphylliae]
MHLSWLSSLFFKYTYTLISAPIWMIQGVGTKRSAIRLPEAQGERKFVVRQFHHQDKTAAIEKPIKVAVIGDSVAAGVGITSIKDALAGQLAAELNSRFDVAVKLAVLAKSGDKIADLHTAIQNEITEVADYVVISIGVNDAKGFTSSLKWSQQLNELMTLIEYKYQPQQTLLLAIPPLECFPLLKKPLASILGFRSSRLNDATNKLLHLAPERFSLVRYELIPDEKYFTADGFHPNETASLAIAKTIVNQYLVRAC